MISLREARERLADLFTPNPGMYWTDLLVSATVGWTAFGVALTREPGSTAHVILCAVAAVALYRGAMFIHELTHLPKGAVPGFQWAWDLLIGVPLLLPSFLYAGVHLDHHRRTVYGTAGDPEYLPLASGPRIRIVWFLVQAALFPVVMLVRFAVLAPLSLVLGRQVRRLVVTHASSLAINFRYARAAPSDALRVRWIACETLASAAALAAIGLTAAGVIPPLVLAQWCAVAAVAAVINQIRTLGAHRWRNAGGEMDVAAQFLDSVNTPGALGTLLAPVGLRFHALHHFVPDLPYHALGKAHRRLLVDPVAKPLYARALATGTFEACRTVWREAATRRTSPAQRDGVATPQDRSRSPAA